jgi:endonuclease/exonuclease/phosphatase family metal-dependent hydrolase
MLNRAPTPVLWALLGLPFLPACSTGSGSSRGLVIDGDTGDWRSGMVTQADGDALYFRFSPGRAGTLQANDETTRLVFDLDNDPATGKALVGPPEVGTLGVDLEILFSPPLSELPPDEASRIVNRRAQRGEPASDFTTGTTIVRHGPGGVITRHNHADAGFLSGPTYAADWFEARLDRHAPALAGSGIDRAGTGRGIVLITDGRGEVARYSDPFSFILPEPFTDTGPSHAAIPAQAPGTIRVMSMNVLRGKPITEPAPFARLIAAVAPDVILFQEADDMTSDSLESWLTGYVGPIAGKHEWSESVQGLSGGSGSWDAVAMPDLGVAIATPHLIAEDYTAPVTICDPDSGRDRPVRAVFAMISTPAGDILACSTHLKCCGSAGSLEDRIRYAETEAINARFAELAEFVTALTGRDIEARIIGGDMNLVGTRGPLETLGAGIGPRGGDLTPVDAPVLGDNVAYTWRDDRSAFGPGRLDWILAGDARVERAFALDTRLIDPAVLAQVGLEPADSAVSDHLPLVVDLKP